MKARRTKQKFEGTTASTITVAPRFAHLREAASRFQDTVWSALEVATSAAFNLTGNSVTDDVFLQLLGERLQRFRTEVERPEEYLLLRKRNEAVPLKFDVAAETAQGLAHLCERTREALLGERRLLSKRGKHRQQIADSLQSICEAAHTFCDWVEMYPRFPEEYPAATWVAIGNETLAKNSEIICADRKKSSKPVT